MKWFRWFLQGFLCGIIGLTLGESTVEGAAVGLLLLLCFWLQGFECDAVTEEV